MSSPISTWSYEAGLLKKLSAPTGQVTIDIAANPALHTILSAQHFKIDPTGTGYTLAQLKADYNLIPQANWIERRIKWNRVTEDPPVLQIEQNIGAADFVDYNVYLLEDAPDYSAIFSNMAAALNDGRTSGYTAAHVRVLMKNMIQAMQKAGLIGGA